MKKILFAFLFGVISVSCTNKEDVILNPTDSFYRQKMRQFVIDLSQYSKSVNPIFKIIPQNGIQLCTIDGEATSVPSSDYLNAIDGISQEGLFYGYENDDLATPLTISNHFKSYLTISKNQGKSILITDYCSDESNVTNSYFENEQLGYVSFSANQRFLTSIPALSNPCN